MSKKWQSVILCSLAMLLILGLSAGVVCLSFAGASIVSVSDVHLREQPASLNVDFSAYGAGKLEMDPSVLYDQACRQTVFLYWEGTDADGKAHSVSGSGFVVSNEGYILTNAHVVSDALEAGVPMKVELFDGRVFDGEIIGADTQSDVALLKTTVYGLMPATLSTAKPKGCQKVYAMGNPDKTLKFTMTSGVVSSLDRTIDFDDGNILNMFQFDAPVNPGNSGGPLYDAYGAVIGIVTAKYMSLNTEGIGFAIPIQDAVKIAGDLKEFGYVRGRPLLGITAIGVEANKLKTGSPAGVMVHSAEEGLAGARAGLTKGDIIYSLNGEKITDMNDLNRVKRNYKAGDTVKIRFWRDGKLMEAYLTFDEVTPEHPTGPVQVEEEPEEKDNAPDEELPAEENGTEDGAASDDEAPAEDGTPSENETPADEQTEAPAEAPEEES